MWLRDECSWSWNLICCEDYVTGWASVVFFSVGGSALLVAETNDAVLDLFLCLIFSRHASFSSSVNFTLLRGGSPLSEPLVWQQIINRYKYVIIFVCFLQSCHEQSCHRQNRGTTVRHCNMTVNCFNHYILLDNNDRSMSCVDEIFLCKRTQCCEHRVWSFCQCSCLFLSVC